MGFFNDLFNYGPGVAFESAKNDRRTEKSCREAERLLAESEARDDVGIITELMEDPELREYLEEKEAEKKRRV